MPAGLDVLRARGRELIGVRVEIVRVHSHPVDTSTAGCEVRGRQFIEEFGNDALVPAPESQRS